MTHSLKNYIQATLIGLALALGLVAAAPATVGAANIEGSLCGGASKLQIDGPTNCKAETSKARKGVNKLITNIVNIFSVIVGIVAVVMIIYGGFKYITSGGNEGNVSSAKNTILYAIIGLVIVALAQFIVRFVLGQATSLT